LAIRKREILIAKIFEQARSQNYFPLIGIVVTERNNCTIKKLHLINADNFRGWCNDMSKLLRVLDGDTWLLHPIMSCHMRFAIALVHYRLKENGFISRNFVPAKTVDEE